MAKLKRKTSPPPKRSSKSVSNKKLMLKRALSSTKLVRCSWVPLNRDYQVVYHDQEWGVPVRDSLKLFEMLNLGGAQAGLSWDTVLRKRANYFELFCGFDPQQIAKFDKAKIAEILENPGIVRNKLKVNAVYSNALAFLKIEKTKPFSDYIWGFTEGKTIQNQWRNLSEIPSSTDLSVEMSKQLKKDGFRFVGPTICYAFMQGVGMVNDHTIDCYRYRELGGK